MSKDRKATTRYHDFDMDVAASMQGFEPAPALVQSHSYDDGAFLSGAGPAPVQSNSAYDLIEIKQSESTQSGQFPRVMSGQYKAFERDAAPGDAGPPGPLPAEAVDWQSRFEESLSLPSETPEQRLQKALSVQRVAKGFCEAAEFLGKIIIEQSVLPVDQRMFKPLVGKGILGGEKYLANGIFFKLTRDLRGLYGGDMGASKAAKHEIKSLQALISCHTPQLFFPLMCVVDYLGLRLVCTSFIRGIGDASLRYGSSDAGNTIQALDPVLNDKIRIACETKLNLRAHNVVGHNKKAKVIWGPADLEGHVLTKQNLAGETVNSYYLLDFSRLFPPESVRVLPSGRKVDGVVIPFDNAASLEYFSLPVDQINKSIVDRLKTGNDDGYQPRVRTLPRSEGVLSFDVESPLTANDRASEIAGCPIKGNAVLLYDIGRIFFYLLRPEFVKSWKEPLSSDALSGFGQCASCTAASKESAELKANHVESGGEAPFPVQTTFCPHDSEPMNLEVDAATTHLIEAAMIKLAQSLDDRVISPSDPLALVREMHKAGVNVRWMGYLRKLVKTPYIRLFLLSEIVARTVRHFVTSKMRQAHTRGLSAVEHAVAVFNIIFGNSFDSDQYWRVHLPSAIVRKFSSAIDDDADGDLRGSVLKFPLFVRLQTATGVVFKRDKVAALFQDPSLFDSESPFTLDDLQQAGVMPRVKTVDLATEISDLLYAIALAESHAQDPGQAEAPALARKLSQLEEGQARKEKENSLRETFFERARAALGENHPEVISSSFKVALGRSRRGQYANALELAQQGIARCEEVFGIFSHEYIVGLISIGEIYMQQGSFPEAIVQMEKALSFTERIHGHHPLIAKLSAYLGRLHMSTGDVEAGVTNLDRAYRVYEEFYGTSVAEYLAPLITMGKAEEIANSLGQLAYSMKALAEARVEASAAEEVKVQGDENKQPQDKVVSLYDRLTRAIALIEDLEGLARGYYHGTSLTLRSLEELKALKVASSARFPESAFATAYSSPVTELAHEKFKIKTKQEVTAGRLASFVLEPAEGVQFDPVVRVLCPAGCVELEGLVAKGGHGRAFQVYFYPVAVGTHTIQIFSSLDWHPQPAAAEPQLERQPSLNVEPLFSFDVQVFAGAPSNVKSYLTGTGYHKGMINTENSFFVHLRDWQNNLIKAEDQKVGQYPIHVDFNGSTYTYNYHRVGETIGDGTVKCTYSVTVPGTYRTTIYLNNKSVQGVQSAVIDAPAGQKTCNILINSIMGSVAVAMCQRCNMARGNVCVRCSRAVFLTQRSHARYCHICGPRLKDTCYGCGIKVFNSNFPASLCQTCAFTPMCVAKK